METNLINIAAFAMEFRKNPAITESSFNSAIHTLIDHIRRFKPGKEEHDGEIYKVYDSFIRGPYLTSNHVESLRIIIDKFLAHFKIRNPKTYFRLLPSKLYSEFMKGISYFKNDPLPDNKPTDKRALIKRYIERLIYNEIFSNTLYICEENRELRHLERLYQNYYPGHKIVVGISYKDIIYPNILRIIFFDKNKQITEEYSRSATTKE